MKTKKPKVRRVPCPTCKDQPWIGARDSNCDSNCPTCRDNGYVKEVRHG